MKLFRSDCTSVMRTVSFYILLRAIVFPRQAYCYFN